MKINGLFDEENEDMITFSSSEMIEREISAAGRGQYNLAVIKISIFPIGMGKDIRIGSKQKEEIGSIMKFIIRSRFRTTDTCFSIERGILLVLLPFTNKEGAEKAEEKLINLFKSHSMTKHFNGKYDIVVNSVQYPDDGKNRQILLEKLFTPL
jgi:hypothetical protein